MYQNDFIKNIFACNKENRRIKIYHRLEAQQCAKLVHKSNEVAKPLRQVHQQSEQTSNNFYEDFRGTE